MPTLTPFGVSGFLTFISSLGFGLLVLFKSRDRALGRSWFIFSLSVAGWGLGSIWMSSAPTAENGLLAGRMAYVIGVLWIAPLFYRFICTFLGLQRSRSIRLHFGIGVLFLLLVPTKLFIARSDYLWHSIYYIRSGPAHYAFFLWWSGLVIYSHFLMARMYGSLPVAKKTQIKYFFLATAVGFSGGTMAYLPDFYIDVYPWGNFTVFLYPIVMSYAIAKHRLMDVSLVFRKTLLYSLITAGLASVYAGTVTLLARLFENGPIPATLMPSVIFRWFIANLRLSFAYSCIGTAIFSFGFSLFVWWRGREKATNLLWALVCLSISLWAFGLGMMVRAGSERSAYFWQNGMQYPGAILIPILFFHFVMSVMRVRARALLWVGYALALVLEALNARGSLVSVHLQPPFHYYAMPLRFYWIFLAYFAVYVVLAHAFLMRGMFSSDPKVKNQTRYIFLGTSIGFAGGATTFLPVYGIPVFPYGDYAVPIYIVTVSYAIFKHQLMDINVVIRKTLLYSLVSAALAAVYVGTITLAAYLLGGRHSLSPAYSSALAAVFITLLFNPLRHRLQTFIDRKFARSQLVNSEQLMKFSSEVIGHERLEKILHSLGRILDDAIHPEFWVLYLRSPNGHDFLRIASASSNDWPVRMPLWNPWADYFLQHPKAVLSPMPVGWEAYRLAVAVPLQGGHILLGYLLLGEKQSEEAYSDEDLILLRLMANQAAVAFERPQLARQISSAFVHEVKMPLANISLPAELTFMELDDVENGTKSANEVIPAIKRRMKYIMDQASLAAQRIDAVRDFAEDEVDHMVRLSLRKVVDSALKTMQALLTADQVKIQVDMSSDDAVIGDAAQLEIVFVNLIKNALEAMRALPEGRPHHLTVESHRQSSQLITRITDSGEGVKPEDRERIFQSHFSTKGQEGAGMGLFICRRILQSHGGTIEAIHTSPGATFELRLPLAG